MAYCTTADLVARFGEQEIIQLTDRERLEAIDESVTALAIADATGEIDSALSVRYALPLQAVPAILTAHACDIARYRLYDDAAPEIVIQRYESSKRWLADIAAGKMNLAGIISDDAVTKPAIRTAAKVFTDSLLSRL